MNFLEFLLKKYEKRLQHSTYFSYLCVLVLNEFKKGLKFR